MTKFTTIKTKLDPTPRQERMLLSSVGGARFAYNSCLAYAKESYEKGEKISLSHYSLRKWWNENKDELAPWWADNGKEVYSNACANLATAYKNFFESQSGKRKGRKVGHPQFRKRGVGKQSFTCTTGSMKVSGVRVQIPSVGKVHCFENVEKLVGERQICRITVSTKAGKWFISILVKNPEELWETGTKTHGNSVGIDLGVKTLATLSDGTAIPASSALEKMDRRIRKANRKLSKTQKGSNRRAKARLHLAKLYERQANIRADHSHKFTTWVSKNYREVCIEDLNVSGMLKLRSLSRRVSDAQFRQIREMIAYKCDKEGVKLSVIDRFFPSSKTCSGCQAVRTKLSLSERTYVCGACGLVIDRDLNAAINILVAGSAPETQNARGAWASTVDRVFDSTASRVLNREPGCGNIETTEDLERHLAKDDSWLDVR